VLLGQSAVLVGTFVAVVWSIPAGGSIIVVAIVLYVFAVSVSDRSLGQLSVH
jgi:zinc transport system permease protein